MRSLLNEIPARWQAAALHTLLHLPEPVLRALAGPPVVIDGQQLAPGAQLLLRLQRVVGKTGFEPQPVPEARANFTQLTSVFNAAPVGGSGTRRRVTVPGPGGPLSAVLYQPDGLVERSPLLVYYHGGGWVVGDPESHDVVCRFLASQAGLRVLSVDYRRAPEHPFPAAVEDALAAFDHAVRHADDLGALPDAVAVGGDSAGGNLAAVVCQLTARRSSGPRPAFQFLLYPATDASRRRPSRDLFAEGFFLGEEQIQWFRDHYVPNEAAHADPRLSPLRSTDLSGLPPAFVATAGFDPLRDEGEEYAVRMREAGVAVVLRRYPDLFHGFANLLAVEPRSRAAMQEAVGVLRAGLAFHPATAGGWYNPALGMR